MTRKLTTLVSFVLAVACGRSTDGESGRAADTTPVSESARETEASAEAPAEREHAQAEALADSPTDPDQRQPEARAEAEPERGQPELRAEEPTAPTPFGMLGLSTSSSGAGSAFGPMTERELDEATREHEQALRELRRAHGLPLNPGMGPHGLGRPPGGGDATEDRAGVGTLGTRAP